LTPDEDIPELRLTASELPEAVEGFYRRALNERPESRFRSVRELYEEFLSLLAPAESQALTPAATGAAATEAATGAAATPAAAPGDIAPAAPASVPPAPVADTAAGASEAPLDWAMEPAIAEPMASQPMAAEPAPAGPAVPAPEPIPAAALPRLDSHAPEAPRHTREVVALEPPAWNGAPVAPPEPRPGSGRWRALRLWDADETVPEDPAAAPREVPLPEPRAAAAEATGPQLPLSTDPDLGVLRGAPPPRNGAGGLEHSDEEAERAVAGLTEMEDVSGLAEEDEGDEPLLAEALGVDLVVEGDEPVQVRTDTPAVGEPNRTVPPLAPPVREVPRPTPVTAAPQIPSVAPAVPRLSPESRPWAPEPRPPPFRREAAPEAPHGREAPVLHPATLADAPSIAARAALPAPPTIPPLRASVPRLSPAPAPAAISTPLSIVIEPSPTRQEKIVVPSPPLEALAATPVAGTPAPARSGGMWSPAELLAQVIAEIQAEERGAGLPPSPVWEPVPLDATQPISTEEVAARMAAETRGPVTTSVAALEDAEDLPALRHEAGRAGMRMALITAIGLIVGILGGWTMWKVVAKPPRPQAERIAEPRQAQAPAPTN
ncbi:MAG: hypothetical protein ACXWK8_03745, partial [Myxococcaceae bacterium]